MRRRPLILWLGLLVGLWLARHIETGFGEAYEDTAPETDWTLSLTGTEGEVCKGDEVSYTVTLQCQGEAPDPAEEVTLTISGGTGTESGSGSSKSWSGTATTVGEPGLTATASSTHGGTKHISLTVVEVDSISPSTEKTCKGESITFVATTDPSGHEDMVTWEAITGSFDTTTGDSVTWTPPADYVSSAVDDVTITATCGDCSDCGQEAKVTVYSVKFPDEEVKECWSDGGTYDAKANLTDESYDKDDLVWTITTEDGEEATIDDEGLVTFGTDGGKYTLKAEAAALTTCFGEMTLYVVRPDIDVDSDYDGAISDDEWPSEESAGGRVGVNQDDDDGGGTPDKDESGTVAGEDDLEPINLKVEPDALDSGTLELDATAGGSRIKVWADAGKGTEIGLPKTWTIGVDTVPATLYVEGIEASAGERDVGLRLRYTSDTTECDDNITLTVVQTDLDIDADYDDAIGDLDDPIEMTAGGRVGVNQDDDDGSDTPDKEDSGTVAGEDDLEPIDLKLDPAAVGSGTLELDVLAGGSKIKVWENATKGGEVTLPKTWTVGSDTVPATLYVEGIEVSDTERDVELRLRYTSGLTECDDNITLTVRNIDLDGQEPSTTGLVDVPDSAELTPGVLLVNNQTRLIVQGPGPNVGDYTLTWTDPANNKHLRLRAVTGGSPSGGWLSSPVTMSSSGSSPKTYLVKTTGPWELSDKVDVVLSYALISGTDTVRLSGIKVDIVGHEPGTMAAPGAQVLDTEEDDPLKLVTAVNDDNDDGGPAGQKDNRDTVVSAADNDMVKVTLKRLAPSSVNFGTMELTVTGAGNVQIFKDGGALLADYSVNLAAPSGDLAPLASGDMDIWLEGLQPSSDVVLKLAYKDTSGVEAMFDELHVTVLRLDLDADIDMDGDIDDDDDPGEDVPSDSCLLVGVNNDTHSTGGENTEVDYADDIINGTDDKDNDLRILKLSLDPSLSSGDLVLRCTGNSSVRIFDDSDNEVIGPSAGTEHTIAASSVPAAGLEYRIEAIAGAQEVPVELAYRPPGGSETGSDTVKVSTVGMSVSDGYSIGSLHKIKAVAVKDSGGKETDRWRAGADSKLGSDNPAYIVVNLKDHVADNTMDDLWADTLKIFDSAGESGISLESAILDDPDFPVIVALLSLFWPSDYSYYASLGYSYDQIINIIGEYPLTEEAVYGMILDVIGVPAGDEGYYWQLPAVYTPGDHVFRIKKDMSASTPEIKAVTVCLFKVELIPVDNYDAWKPEKDNTIRFKAKIYPAEFQGFLRFP